MPVSVQQWRGAIGSFTHVRLVNRIPYTHAMHNEFLHVLLKYLLLCVFYTYTYVYTYMLVHYILSSCMIKLFFSVSVNNLFFSSVDDMLHNDVLHYMYLAKCFQYIITLIFFMCSLQLLHIVYSTFFKSLLRMALTGKVCYKYYYNIMHVKKNIFVNCQHMMMLYFFPFLFVATITIVVW